jgi:hypothetical protein
MATVVQQTDRTVGMSYTLEDGTGTIEALQYHPDSGETDEAPPDYVQHYVKESQQLARKECGVNMMIISCISAMFLAPFSGDCPCDCWHPGTRSQVDDSFDSSAEFRDR